MEMWFTTCYKGLALMKSKIEIKCYITHQFLFLINGLIKNLGKIVYLYFFSSVSMRLQ